MSDSSFHVDVLTRAQAARLVLHGAFDLAAAPRFREVVTGLHGTGVRSLVVDLRPLELLDARGLNELVQLDGEARRNGHDLAVVRAGSHVDDVFRMSGLDEHFVFVDAPQDLTPP